MKRWFGRWDATYWLHDASLDSLVIFATQMYHDMGKIWRLLTHYTTHVAPNYKIVTDTPTEDYDGAGMTRLRSMGYKFELEVM